MESKEPVAPNTSGSDTSSSLSAMYVLAALLMLVASIVVIVLMLIRSNADTELSGDQLYEPGSVPSFTPISRPAGLTDPPGVTLLERGHYRVVIEAFNWSFEPSEIRLPLGASVDLVMRSSQDYHGLAIVGTDILVQLFHNTAATASYTFDKPGEYLFVCSEYCGAGHVTMTGKIIVE